MDGRLIVWALLVVGVCNPASRAVAAGVVGDGTASSCTAAALVTALSGGGLVTFNCGGPTSIDMPPGEGTIETDTTIDGGSVIAIGGRGMSVFAVDWDIHLTLSNLAIGYSYAETGPNEYRPARIDNNGGMLTVTNSTFAWNAGTLGAVIYNSGVLHVMDSRFDQNYAGAGGAIFNGGTATVTRCTFAENEASFGTDNWEFGGGAIYNADDAMLMVADSTFSGNGGSYGGAIYNHPGAFLTVTGSTFRGNAAIAGSAIENDGYASLTNSTFIDNPSGWGLYGGAIFNAGTLSILNCTVTGNNACSSDVRAPGGIFNDANATLLLSNTLVANNAVDEAECTGTSLTASNCAGPIMDGGHNLDDGTSCGFSAANGSLVSTDPQLDPAGLQSNGGSTQTVALCTAAGIGGCAAASPAINAGAPAVCAATPVSNRDQRGFVRPGGGHTQCSIGAYEADATPAEPCIGDCGADGSVSIDELVTLVSITLGNTAASACAAGVPRGGAVDISLIIEGVNSTLTDECSAANA